MNAKTSPRLLADSARIIMLTVGSMEKGGSYWCYVAVKPSRLAEYKKHMSAKNYNIQNFAKDGFGEVVVSGPGEVPPDQVTLQVAKFFDLEVKDLFRVTDAEAEIQKKLQDLQEKIDAS